MLGICFLFIVTLLFDVYFHSLDSIIIHTSVVHLKKRVKNQAIEKICDSPVALTYLCINIAVHPARQVAADACPQWNAGILPNRLPFLLDDRFYLIVLLPSACRENGLSIFDYVMGKNRILI